MRKIVIDLMNDAHNIILLQGMINIVEEHHGSYDKWLRIGPIAPDTDGHNTLNEIASEHIEVGDFVIVLFEVPEVYDRAFDQFIFRAFEEWGPITVYTEPTTVL